MRGLRFTAALSSGEVADEVMDCLPPSPLGLPIKVYSNGSERLRELLYIQNIFQAQLYRKKSSCSVLSPYWFLLLGGEKKTKPHF